MFYDSQSIVKAIRALNDFISSNLDNKDFNDEDYSLLSETRTSLEIFYNEKLIIKETIDDKPND